MIPQQKSAMPDMTDATDATDATDEDAMAQPQDPAEVRADPDGSAGTDEAVSDAQDGPNDLNDLNDLNDPSANEHEDTA
jgi:hypothetical protein